MILDKVIVMDDVSGLTDKSNEFANFLTVSRKYRLTCVYIFHTIYLTRQNWHLILSQTKIFNFFPGSVKALSIIKILSSFASRYKRIISLIEIFASIDYIVRFLTLDKNNA